MIILEKSERADPLWGMDTEIITDEMIEALEQGKRLYLSVNNEYAVVIKKDGKRKTDKPEHTRCKRLIDADAFKAYMKDALEQTRNAYTDGGEWAQTITEQFCKDIDEQPTIEFDSDAISRKQALEHLKKRLYESALNNDGIASKIFEEIADNRVQIWVDELPPSPTVTADTDTVSRQKMINTVNNLRTRCDNDIDAYRDLMVAAIEALPPSPTVTADPDTISRQQIIHCKDCRWRNDYGHWLGCPVLNTDDDNYCSFAELP